VGRLLTANFEPRTVWWGREDSNFQPNDYQPLALSIEQQPFVFVATMALISIFNRSWLVGHRSTQLATKT
jgi:hypothetical protein